MVHAGKVVIFVLVSSRVAQIVESWQRRCEKVEDERENGRKWSERERERDASALFCSAVFCRKMLKYGTFCREMLKYATFCRKMLKYGTFCRKSRTYALRENNSE